MAIKPETVVISSGKHDMGARAGAPANLQNLRDGAYSLHHVLPYRYPLFIGFLASTYRDTLVSPDQRPNWPSAADSDERATKVAQILKVVSRFGAAQQDLPSRFAWMGPNLFQGPAGNLRLDDPGSGRETNRPDSMEQDLWKQLTLLGTKVDEIASLSSDGGNYTATIAKDITVGVLDQLLTAMLPLAARGHGNALSFKSTDWLCLTSDIPEYRMAANAQVTGDFKQKFKALISSKPTQVVTRKPGDDGQPVNTVLWRLRLENEPVPGGAVTAPRLQP